MVSVFAYTRIGQIFFRTFSWLDHTPKPRRTHNPVLLWLSCHVPLGCNRVFSVCVGVWCFGLCFRCIKKGVICNIRKCDCNKWALLFDYVGLSWGYVNDRIGTSTGNGLWLAGATSRHFLRLACVLSLELWPYGQYLILLEWIVFYKCPSAWEYHIRQDCLKVWINLE